MRRLTGFSFGTTGPARSGYLAFGDLTVLCGANDSGKSRLLAAVAEVLRDPAKVDHGRLFGVMASEDLDALAQPDDPWFADQFDDFEDARRLIAWDAPEGLTRVAVNVPSWHGGLNAFRWGRSGWELGQLGMDRLAEVADIEWQDQRAEREPLLEQYLGMVPAWVLPVPVSVPQSIGEIEQTVGRAMVALTRGLREVAELWPSYDEMVEELELDLDHDWSPTEEEWDAVWVYRWMPWHQDPTDSRATPSPLWLLNNDRRKVEVHPNADLAAQTFNAALARMLPEFVTDDYEVEVHVQPPAAVASGAMISIRLTRLDTYEFTEEGETYNNDVPLSFDLRNAPSGFQLWIQLALLELSARVIGFTEVLAGVLHNADLIHSQEGPEPGQTISWNELREQMLSGAAREPEPEPEPEPPNPKLVAIKHALETVLGRFPAVTEDPFHIETNQLRAVLDQAPVIDESVPGPGAHARDLPPAPTFFPTRFFLIDEPEQRLHPALQRRAARWLASTMDRWNTQALIATHSLAFIDIPGNVAVHQLTREAETSQLTPIDVEQLGTETQLIRELGLDRGELLSKVNAFLFTDTPQLALVLDALHHDRFQRSGIEVRALQPGRAGHGLGQLELLARITNTPILTLFTTLDPQQIRELDQAAETELGALNELARTDGPLSTAAAITVLRVRQERPLQLDTLGANDILDLFDDETIAEHCQPGATPFPGVAAARTEFARAEAESPQSFADFALRRYGLITDIVNLRAIARTMNLFDRRASSRLDDVLWQLDQAILTAQSPLEQRR